MKKILLSLMMLIIAMSVFAMGGADNQTIPEGNTVIRFGVPKAPPVWPILKMMEDKSLGEDISIKLDFWETPEQLIAMVQGGQHNMYAFPLPVIAKLYNKGMPVVLTNADTWGVTYFLSSDPSVKTWKDLKGKTIYVTLKSAPPDLMTQVFLKKAGLKKGDYELRYAGKTELAKMMVMGKVENAVSIEPLVSMVTMKNKKMKVIMNYEEEWRKMLNTDKKLPTAGIGAMKKFTEENRDLVLKFEKEYAKALKWVKENPAEAGALAQKYLGMKKMMIQKAIPNMGLEYVSAQNAKPDLDEFYQFLYNFNPKMVGGKVPNSGMYFK